MKKARIILAPLEHRGRQVAIRFEKHAAPELAVRALKGRRWSQSKGTWYVPFTPGCIEMLVKELGQKFGVDATAFMGVEPEAKKPEEIITASPPANIAAIEKLATWMRFKRFSENTVKAYCECLQVFSKVMAPLPFEKVTRDDMVIFNTRYIIQNSLSVSYQSHFVSALKLLFRVMHFETLKPADLERPRKPFRLPHVLSQDEVRKVLTVQTNIKHRCMLSLIYAAGLRAGELLALKVSDIQMDRHVMHVRDGKGSRDRVVPLSVKMGALVRAYMEMYQPGKFLFSGSNGNERYSSRSLQQVLQHAVTRAGINKPVTLHWLRHSYATHLLEGGTNLRYIQELPGHKSSKTTEIYTHVNSTNLLQIRSPFDAL